VQLFREGDFRSALVEFQRSYDLSKNFKVLYNIGQTQYELSDYAGALRSFRRYLQEGASEIDAKRRGEVEDDLRKLGDRVATLDIQCNVEGAEVLVDDVVIGRTPLSEGVLVSMGRRKVVVQKDGIVAPARFVDLAGGDRVPVKVELSDARPRPQRCATRGARARLTATPRPRPPPEPSNTGFWVSLAVTGGLWAGTGIVGGLALSAHSDEESRLGTYGATAADISSAHSKTKSLALVADVLGGTAIAMTAVTILLGTRGGDSDAPAASTATLRIGPGNVAVRGEF
jgi:tetratricopeptide (TPR) repeat protein